MRAAMFVKLAATVVLVSALSCIIMYIVGEPWGIAFVVVGVIVIFLQWFHARARHGRDPPMPGALQSTSQEPPQRSTVAPLPHPLEPAAGPPVFVYEKKGGGDECSVCLGELQGGESVKQLPACAHLFHEGCIDMWLSSHSTCPVCRSPVDAAGTAADVVVRVPP